MSTSRAFIIGPGEVGRRLSHALKSKAVEVSWVTRSEGWDEALSTEGAMLVLCMREDDLEAAWERLREVPRESLVLVQNGFLEAPLGPLGAVTRGLIWFMSKGEHFHPLWPSVFHGPHADVLASALRGVELEAEVSPNEESYLKEMILKGVWNGVVGLPLAVGGVDLATYRSAHREELAALLDESARAASAEYGVTVTGEEALARVDATTEPIGFVKGGAKALPWRNGAVARFGRAHGVATPVNDRLLRAVDFDPDSEG